VKTRILLVSVVLGTTAIPALAQEPTVNDRVAKSMPSKYTPAQCGLKTGHFKVSSAATYLKTGIETEVPANKTRALNKGREVAIEAIGKNGQEKNPAAWYYLGRLDLQQGDIVGADTAFTRAEALAPPCKEEISKLRYVAWVPLVNAAIDFTKASNNDSALALFRQANTIYRDKPQSYLNGGIIFANTGKTDSAIVYWQKAAEIAERTNSLEDRNLATRNLGAALQRANRHQEAVPVLEKYLGWVPNDAEVKRALASSYRVTGQTEKAQALEKEVGVAPTPAGAAGGSANELNAAVALYNQKSYDKAAAAFEQVVAAEPYNRDALFGLANSYLGLKNGPKLAESATRLIAIEPMNEDVIRMLATGQRLSKKEAAANKTAIQALALPTTLTVTQFAPTADGATITGNAKGREAQTLQGKPIAGAPVTLIFEFLDAKGGVVANQQVDIPALKPGETHAVEAKGQGAGIVGWRYKKA
jgi:tetratricopeptide (TPR) repeat protein